MSQAPSATLRTIAVHRAGADWGEGASSSAGGLGATPAPGDATWLHTFFPGQFWTSQGGDFVAAVSASTPVGGVGFYSWKGPAMAGDVQAWLDQPATNFGWVLLGDETVSQTVKRFDSRENTTSANRPVLIVHYSTSIPTRPSTWSGIKTR
jgi:hypothetical protein